VPIPHPPSPTWLSRPARPILAAGAVGAVSLAALAAADWADLRAAAMAIAVVMVVTGLLAGAVAGRREEGPASSLLINASAERAALPWLRLLDALPDPVLVVSAREPDDPIGKKFVLVNAAARELLRIQRDEGLLVTVLRDPHVLGALDEALFQGQGAQASYEPAGSQDRVLRVAARPLEPGPDGARLALLTFHDDTELYRIEQTRVDFLANASHELRTPLTSLRGFIETLRGHARGDPAAQDRFLGIMQAQAERMSRLIDDLLSLSRIELSEHVPPSDTVNLVEVARDVADALAPQAKARGVRIEVDTPEAPAQLTGDHDQLVQVVQNLTDNALKYSPQGGVVRIAVESGLPAEAAAGPRRKDAHRLPLLTPDLGMGPFVAVTVSDQGPGIAREHLPRLTERFYRVEGQKSGDRLGTGLGLAIVKHILNRHYGGLVVESAPGQGTAFSAYLPILEPAEAEVPPMRIATQLS
jgi:two-component system phosphate regulon sensor histidine kinase PhoR